MQVDYLIAGGGASGLAFLDVILNETDATVAMVDRRDAPGGHWNDAYPFVRLHQSSSFYGVPSRPLGQDRVCREGYNAGLFELATKYEILHYYQDLLENVYLPSGRVHYFPMSEYQGDGVIRSLVSGQETRIGINRKLVRAGVWGDQASIPLTHRRSFEVADDVDCIPPNDLPHRAPEFAYFTVLGAGKTGMDALLWLLAHGVDPDRIQWVRPSEYWLFHRDNILPHRKFFFETMDRAIAELDSLATSKSVAEHCQNLEACGMWHRIDENRWPEKFHTAVCSGAEVAALRTVKDVLRGGHVKSIEADRLTLEDGAQPVAEKRLYIDCTARAGVILDTDKYRVFDGDTINLLMVRPAQPVFSAALIAHLEACIDDDEIRQSLTRVTNFHDTPGQFLAVQAVGFLNQGRWRKIPEVSGWIDTCRLNSSTHLLAGIGPDDTEKLAMLRKLGPMTGAALENIPRMLANSSASA